MAALRILSRHLIGEDRLARLDAAGRRLGARLDPAFLLAAIATSALKVASAALNYALLVLLARLMSVEDFGLYGILFSAMALVGAFVFFGQPVLVLKSIPHYAARGDGPRQKGVVVFGLTVLLAMSALFLALLAGAHGLGLLPAWLSDLRLAAAFGALTVVYALSDYTCNVLRAFGRTYEGLVPRDIAWRLLAIAALLAMAHGRMPALAAPAVDVLAVTVLLGALLAVLVGWQLWRIVRLIARRLPGPAAYDLRAWWASSGWMALGSILFAVSLTLDTVIVGALLGAQDAAVYFAAVRTAGLSALLLVGLRLIAAPVFAHLHAAEAHGDLRRRIEAIYGLSIATAALFALAGYVLAPQIMALFGAGYEAGIGPFRILLVGLSVATAGGISSAILESTGGERINAGVLLATQAATALAVAAGAIGFGLYGAALAKAVGAGAEAVLLSFIVFRRLGPRAVGKRS